MVFIIRKIHNIKEIYMKDAGITRYFSLALIIFILVTSFSTARAEKAVTLTYVNFFPPQSRISLLAVEWNKELEKRTNGRVAIKYYPGAVLVPPEATYNAVARGSVDIGLSCFAYTPGKFPLTEVIDLPLGYKSGYVATKMINEYYKKFNPKELSEVKVLYLHAHGPGILHMRKPVDKLEDLKGRTIRSTGLSSEVVSALGGIPVGMPMTEAYYALNNGLAEGIMNPMESLMEFKLGEVISYSVEDFGAAYTTGFFVVMNKKKWGALSPDIRNIIEKMSEEWIEKQGKLWDELDKEGRGFTLRRGNKIIQLSNEENERWAQRVKPLLDRYVKSMRSKGLPGEDALKFCLDYLKANQK